MLRRINWVTGLFAAATLAATGCCTTNSMCGTGVCTDGCGVAPVGGGCGLGFDMLGAHTYNAMTCGAGCGGVYWGEWINDPPACCDPCDDCGNWIGPQPCGSHFAPNAFWDGWKSLWGYRYAGMGCDSGCSTCGGEVIQKVPQKVKGGMPNTQSPPLPPPEPMIQSTSTRRASYTQPSSPKTIRR